MQKITTRNRPRTARYLAASALGFALTAPPLALAQSWNAPGWYAGAGVGQSTLADEQDVLAGDIDDSDTGWKIFGGTQFHPNAAVELGWVDFGEFTGTGATWEATGINVSLLGSWPVANQFSLFGKLGATRWDVDSNVAGATTSENGTDFSYGIGAQYDFRDNVGARLEWERFNDVGDEPVTGRSDLDLVSVSVVFGF